MSIVSIKHDVEWPGIPPTYNVTLAVYPDAGSRVSWALLRDALERLEVGETLILQTGIEYIQSARQAVYQYAHHHGVTFLTDSWNNQQHGFLRVHRTDDQRKEL